MLPAQELSIEYDTIGSIRVVGACRLPTVIDQALPGNAFEAAEGKSSQMLLRRHADISQSDNNFLIVLLMHSLMPNRLLMQKSWLVLPLDRCKSTHRRSRNTVKNWLPVSSACAYLLAIAAADDTTIT